MCGRVMDGQSHPERLSWQSGTSQATVKAADWFIWKALRAWPDVLTEALGRTEKLLEGGWRAESAECGDSGSAWGR